jgi:hypothetical protein
MWSLHVNAVLASELCASAPLGSHEKVGVWRERLVPCYHTQKCRSDESAIEITMNSTVVHPCRCNLLGRDGDTDGRTGDIGSSTRDAGAPRMRLERRSIVHGQMQLRCLAPRASAVPGSLSFCVLYHPSTFRTPSSQWAAVLIPAWLQPLPTHDWLQSLWESRSTSSTPTD